MPLNPADYVIDGQILIASMEYRWRRRLAIGDLKSPAVLLKKLAISCVVDMSSDVIDPTLFAAGALFTQDYLQVGIRNSAAYKAVDIASVRAALTKIAAGLPRDSEPNEATTELDFIWPVLEALGWDDYLTQQNLSGKGRVDVPDGLLFIDTEAKAQANTLTEVDRFGCGAAILESKRWGRPLDRAEGKTGAAKDTPSTQLLRYLRRIDDLTTGNLRWGILTNGSKWRLYFAGARSVIDDYLELDLSFILKLEDNLIDKTADDEERDHWLAVFVSMFGRPAFECDSVTGKSFHDRARTDAALYEERVAASLSDLVFKRLYPELGKAVAAESPADTPLEEVRQATLVLLYRLLFLLYAEDRGLLPVRDKRFDDYALRPKRLEVQRRKDDGDVFSDTAPALWNHLSTLTTIIDKGDPSLGVPPYNGGLFSEAQTPLLANIKLGDAVMADALDILSFEQSGGQRSYINYRDLSVQQLGSIYERLLEFELTRDEEGVVDIRPNIFARKSSGSYYTPDELVLLILDETLQPLVDDTKAAFDDAIASRDTSRSVEQQIHRLQKRDPAAAITRLRICDPAMGSGHFLVSLVDRLTNHALSAIAEAAELAGAAGLDEYESPVAEDVRKIRATIQNNADEKSWAVTDEQLDDPQLVKRMVLKRCVYGVDKNPMAVELAKVSLWLHTFTVGAPLSFIDHHLAAGDSLFGLWVGDAIDKAGRGGELFLHEPLQRAQTQASVMETIEALTDAEIGEAHRSARMWEGVEAQTGELDSFVSFTHALDWLAAGLKGDELKSLKTLRAQWLDGVFGDPMPIARGKKAPSGGTPENLDGFAAIWKAARNLIEDEQFLNWQITFPGVWKNWDSAELEGGFDAIVGNPPWAKVELEAQKWFAGRDESIVNAANNSEREEMIEDLRLTNPALYDGYLLAKSRFSLMADVAKRGGAYPLLGSGRPNLYQLFVEQALRLVKSEGIIGLLVPSGIISDKGCSKFVRSIGSESRFLAFYDYENRLPNGGKFFDEPDARLKFAAFFVGGKDRCSAEINSGFFLKTTDRAKIQGQIIPLSIQLFERFNPLTGTAIIFRSKDDARITSGIYERVDIMHAPGLKPVWPVEFSQMLNQSNDSGLFKTSEWLKKDGWYRAPLNRWGKGEGQEAYPLYEGKMVQAFDHRAADIVFNPQNRRRPAQPQEIEFGDHCDPLRMPKPRAFVRKADIPNKARLDWMLAYKDTTAATNMRSMIAMVLPTCGAVHALPVLLPDGTKSESFADYCYWACLALGNLNSTIFDYLGRQKVQTTHFSWYIVKQLPVISSQAYRRNFGPKSADEIVKETVLELTYTSHDMAPFAKDMGYVDKAGEVMPPFAWDEERRLHLRAKLDALYFILYGVFDSDDRAQGYDDVDYIYSTFTTVERLEQAAFDGKYRSRDLCLNYINALLAGQPDAQIEG